MIDPVLLHDWHPVGSSAAVAPGAVLGASLLGQDLALWRSPDGRIHAWEDRCPHRGTRFTLGRVEADSLVCRYHGWRFAADGHCVHVPAQPAHPARDVCARRFLVEERHGLVWASLGEPARGLPPFPECDDPGLRKVVCGPYRVACSGLRIVENFLDMAHFAFVHDGVLGDLEHAEVPDYEVGDYVDVDASTGVRATRCQAWQPRSNQLSQGGTWVEYTYRVMRPLTAILTKLPEAQAGFREAIGLHVQPLSETSSDAWVVLAMTNDSSCEDELRGFQDQIFLQDLPILENQVPSRLPLAPRAEASIRCDGMSRAYRAYLRGLGLTFGVVP